MVGCEPEAAVLFCRSCRKTADCLSQSGGNTMLLVRGCTQSVLWPNCCQRISYLHRKSGVNCLSQRVHRSHSKRVCLNRKDVLCQVSALRSKPSDQDHARLGAGSSKLSASRSRMASGTEARSTVHCNGERLPEAATCRHKTWSPLQHAAQLADDLLI